MRGAVRREKACRKRPICRNLMQEPTLGELYGSHLIQLAHAEYWLIRCWQYYHCIVCPVRIIYCELSPTVCINVAWGFSIMHWMRENKKKKKIHDVHRELHAYRDTLHDHACMAKVNHIITPTAAKAAHSFHDLKMRSSLPWALACRSLRDIIHHLEPLTTSFLWWFKFRISCNTQPFQGIGRINWWSKHSV